MKLKTAWVIGLVALQQGCGKQGAEPGKITVPHLSKFERVALNQSTIEGNWVSDCTLDDAGNNFYIRTRLSVDQGSVSKTVTKYLGSDCSQDILITHFSGTSLLEGETFSQNYSSVQITSKLSILVAAFNLAPYYCGRSDWALGRTQDVSPVNDCGFETVVVSKIDVYGSQSRGQTYELFLENVKMIRDPTARGNSISMPPQYLMPAPVQPSVSPTPTPVLPIAIPIPGVSDQVPPIKN